MKKLITLLLIVLIAVSSTVYASSATADKLKTGKTVVTIGDWVYEKINKDTQWELDKYIGSGSEVITPRFLSDLLIVSFGDHCFANNSTVKSVVTSSPLWTIGEYAFIDCTSLESIELNFALDKIGVGAFSGTSSLKNINLEDTVVTKINSYTFLNSGIEKVVLPNTCKEISSYAFGQCSKLTEITIPYTVTNIAGDAFKGCTNLKIKGHLNSYAQKYAKENGFTFEPLETLYGDANGDGKIGILDVTAIQKYKIGEQELSDYGLRCADVNHDGKVTVRDATLIQMKIAKYDVDF